MRLYCMWQAGMAGKAISGTEVSDALYADSFGMTLKYGPNRKAMPDLV